MIIITIIAGVCLYKSGETNGMGVNRYSGIIIKIYLRDVFFHYFAIILPFYCKQDMANAGNHTQENKPTCIQINKQKFKQTDSPL